MTSTLESATSSVGQDSSSDSCQKQLAMSGTSCAALSVVTEATLWVHLNSFLPGLPFWTVDYARRHGKDESVLHVPSVVQHQATQERDVKTLQRLNYLKTQPEYKGISKVAFRSAMHYAAINGQLDRVKWLHENTTAQCQSDTMAVAACNEHADVVYWLQHNRPESQESMRRNEEAFPRRGGEYGRRQPAKYYLMDAVASKGYIDVVRVLHEERKEGCTTAAMDEAARNGHLNVVEYLHTHRTEGCTSVALDSAALNGHLEVVKFLLTHRTESGTKLAVYGAATHGHLDILRLLWGHEKPCREVFEEGIRWAITSVIRAGDCETLSFIKELYPNIATLVAVVTHGQLDIIQRFQQTNSTDDSGDALIYAVQNGRAATATYLLDNITFSLPVLQAAEENAKSFSLKVALQMRILALEGASSVFAPMEQTTPKPTEHHKRLVKRGRIKPVRHHQPPVCSS